MEIPNSQPVFHWAAKEKSGLSPARYLKLFLIPSAIFPFFAGFNPATFTESDLMPVIEPIVRIIYLIFDNTVIVESKILFFIVFYLFSLFASYIFLAALFIPVLFLFSLIFDKTNCFAIFPEGIAKGHMKKGMPEYHNFLTWDKVQSYESDRKNEIRLAGKKNKALMFVYYTENNEEKIRQYLAHYTGCINNT